ncbi:MAG: fibronectin type III domain-containing protein, partial [Actinomycetia bacterium]|nr:fibronectin type III domain-containing protein [Actinomycetes bacterium]
MTADKSIVRLIGKSSGTAKPIYLGEWDFSTEADPAPPSAPGKPSATAKGGDDIATVTITPGSPQGDRYVASVPLDQTNRAYCTVNQKTGGSCILDGLANGQTYSGQVVAQTEDGQGGWIDSEAGSFSVRPLPNPPPKPTIHSLIAGDGSVEAKVYGDDGTAARFEVSGQQDGYKALVNCTIPDAPLSSETDPKGCTLTGLTNFRETFVNAFAVDEFGQKSALADTAMAIPHPPFPGAASTKCNQLTRNCTTTGRLPGGADTAQQSIRGVKTLVPAPPFPGTCTKESVQSGLTPFVCSSTLPSYGQWMFTTSAVGTAGPVQKQELITINPPSFEGRDGSITVTCDDTTRTCTTEGTRPSGTTGVVQRASAFDELTQTNGKPNRTAQCSYPTPTSYRCVINLDYGKWDLSTQAKKGDTLLSEDVRTVVINAPEFGNKPGGGSALPGAGGSYAFSCAPWDGNSQACRAEGRTPQKTASVAMVAQRTATATTTSSTVRDECRIIGSPATYQCAVDLTRGQWTVTTTAYDAAKKIVARQIETVTIAPPFGDPSVGGSARVECERRSGFSSLHFICVAEGTKIRQPALYQLRANLS